MGSIKTRSNRPVYLYLATKAFCNNSVVRKLFTIITCFYAIFFSNEHKNIKDNAKRVTKYPNSDIGSIKYS
jgi:hypothetical protein